MYHIVTSYGVPLKRAGSRVSTPLFSRVHPFDLKHVPIKPTAVGIREVPGAALLKPMHDSTLLLKSIVAWAV
jgi:hypothetical protein